MKTKFNSMNQTRLPLLLIGIFACLLLINYPIVAQDDEGEESQWENFNPADFDDNSINIDNDWMPLKPGMRYVYTGTTLDDDGNPLPHRVLIHVTDLVKVIEGVKCVVSLDMDFESGALIEAELAFFAQDKEGNVWRMGEYPEEYDEEGNFDAAPCWISGVKKAVAGISMRANPWVDSPSYSQGWAPSVDFTDRGKVDQMGLRICGPMGCFDNVMVISETSLEEEGIFQLKYWAQGTGNIQVGYKGDDPTGELLQLVDVMQLGPDGIADLREKAFELEASAYRHSRNVYGETEPCFPRE
jgi:hypothetical protein